MRNKLASRILLVGFAATLIAAFGSVLMPQKAYAAGESYNWSGNQIHGTRGLFSTLSGGNVTFNKDTNKPNSYTGIGNVSGCGTNAMPRYTITLTGPNNGTIATTRTGCPGAPNVTGTINTIIGTAPAGAYDPNATGGTGGPRAAEEDGLCDKPGDFLELNFWMCPIINGTADMAEKLDAAILELIFIKTEPIFNSNKGGNADDEKREAESSAAFFKAWSAFRNIAYAILIIIGLIMVASQVLGFDFVDAYTIRKMLPKLVLAVFLIAISWRAAEFLISAANAAGSAAQAIIGAPFAGINAGIGTEAGDITIGAIIGVLMLVGAGVGLAILAIMGPAAVGTFVISAGLAVLSGWVILVTRNTVADLLIVMAPIPLALWVYGPFSKITSLFKGVGIAILLSIVAIAAWLKITKVAALVTYIGGGQTGALVALIILIIGYALLLTIMRKMDTVYGAMGNVASQATNKIQGQLSNYRKNSLKQRKALWETGGLMSQNNAVGRGFNSLGRRVGLAKNINATAGGGGYYKAFAGRQDQREAGLSLMDNVNRDQAENNPLMRALANNDDANAVMAGSGGVNTMAALRQSAQLAGIDPDSARGQAAIAAAQAVGVNRTNAMTSLRTALKNKGRGIAAGNVEFLDHAVRGLSRNASEYNGLGYEAAFFARSNGRTDLGGTDWVSYGRDNAAWDTARATVAAAEAQAGAPLSNEQARTITWQSIGDSTALNGLERTPAQAITGGHDNSVAQTMQTLSRVVQQQAPANAPEAVRNQINNQRLRAAIELKEIQASLPGVASGSARDEVNAVLYGTGQGQLGLDPSRAIATQLTDRFLQGTTIQVRNPQTGTVETTPITPEVLTTMGRTYPEYDAENMARRQQSS